MNGKYLPEIETFEYNIHVASDLMYFYLIFVLNPFYIPLSYP